MKYSLSRFSVAPQRIKTAQRAVQRLVKAIQKTDPGLVYLVFQETGKPVFFTLVSFQDEDAYRRFATSPYAARFAREILKICDGKPSFIGLDLVAAARRESRASTASPPATPRPARNHRRRRPAAVRLAQARRR
jgi:quinol monooxygenase YgiN